IWCSRDDRRLNSRRRQSAELSIGDHSRSRVNLRMIGNQGPRSWVVSQEGIVDPGDQGKKESSRVVVIWRVCLVTCFSKVRQDKPSNSGIRILNEERGIGHDANSRTSSRDKRGTLLSAIICGERDSWATRDDPCSQCGTHFNEKIWSLLSKWMKTLNGCHSTVYVTLN